MLSNSVMQSLFENSIFVKYIGYVLPLLVYIFIKSILNYSVCMKTERKTYKYSDSEATDSNNATDSKTIDTIADEAFKPYLPELEHIPYGGITAWLDKSGDRFYKLANDRRSIRKFCKNKSVDLRVIEKCILAAGTSPSGAHTEPWTFCVIQDAQVKQNIRKIVEAEEDLNYTQRMSRQWTIDLRPLKTDCVKEYLTDAPFLIIVFKQIYGIRSDGTKQQHYYNEISTSIATGILLCALQSAGLNSLVTTPLNCGPAIRTLLNRPQNEKLLVLLPVGYAASDCRIPDLQRKSIDDILVTY